MDTTQRLLTFEVADQLCALPLHAVEEITHMAELVSPPESSAFVNGFLDLGHSLIAVIDLRLLWNLPACAIELYTPLIVLATCDLALKVDAVDNIVAVSQNAILPLRENHTLNNCIQATCTVADRQAHILNIDQLLLEEEQARIADLKHKIQGRLHKLEAQIP